MTSDRTTEPDVHGRVNVTAAAEQLRDAARTSNAGRAGRTLTPGAGVPLKQALLALVRGQRLADHESPGAATVHVLTGSVRLTADGADLDLGPGDLAPIPPVRHGLLALDDAVVLLTVAQGT